MKSTASERFTQALDFICEIGLASSRTEIAKTIGVSSPALSMAASGYREPDIMFQVQLWEHYPIDLGWLRHGTGEMISEQRKATLVKAHNIYNEKIKELERQLRQIRRKTAVSCK